MSSLILDCKKRGVKFKIDMIIKNFFLDRKKMFLDFSHMKNVAHVKSFIW